MITWMQKHKRYLIVTIWISTVAFIAAGMVGWGAYSFSSSAGVLAKVGSIKISADDFNREYQAIYNNYNERHMQLTGSMLDNEQAKLLGLESLTMQRLIDKALLENFALDSGIRISDEEVAKEIQSVEAFKQNGEFSNTLYKEVLKQNRIKPSTFEANVKRDMLVQKILAVFPALATPAESDIFSIPERLEDRLAIQVIPASQVKIDTSDTALEEFYEKNKHSYKTPKAFEVEVLKIAIDDIPVSTEELKEYYNTNKSSYTENGAVIDFDSARDSVIADFRAKEAQKNALRKYVDFKDNKIHGDSQTLSENKISSEMLQALNDASEGDTIKPIRDGDSFSILKLTKKIPQEIKTFQEAKNDLIATYRSNAQQEALKKEAESRLNVFAGRDIGFYRFNDTRAIPELQEYQKQQLLANVFNGSSKNGFVIFDDKAVLYRILKQKMLKDSSNNQNMFNAFKSGVLERTIVEFLAKQYKIINNFKKDS